MRSVSLDHGRESQSSKSDQAAWADQKKWSDQALELGGEERTSGFSGLTVSSEMAKYRRDGPQGQVISFLPEIVASGCDQPRTLTTPLLISKKALLIFTLPLASASSSTLLRLVSWLAA